MQQSNEKSPNNEIDYNLWNFKLIVQEFTSEHTSINSNKMPKTIKKIEQVLVAGQKWADIGGGKFNNIQEHLSKFGVELLIYDPFNQSEEHNDTVVKHNQEKNTYSFIRSPDFDTKDEPTVGDSILVDTEGKLKLTRQKKDPQIYHHKWNFVKNDYSGFDIAQSVQRSIAWKSVLGKNKQLSSKIGTSGFWEQTLKDFTIVSSSTFKLK